MAKDFPIDLIAARSRRPDGCPDHYILGWKAVKADLTTRDQFRWYPWTVVRSDWNLKKGNHACPRNPGDGLCIALNMRGAASAGFPARTLVAAWYDPGLVCSRSQTDKIRVSGEIYVGDVFATENLLQEPNLSGININGANLRRCELIEARLDRAHMVGLSLAGGRVAHSYLREAELQRAGLVGVRMDDVDLSGANMALADLSRANLVHVDLGGTNLRGSNLNDADLTLARLHRSTKLEGVIWNSRTLWPSGFLAHLASSTFRSDRTT